MPRTPEDTPTDPDGLIRYGTIASVDHAAARVTVTVDEGETSPPLRWAERRMGGTKSWSPPSVGEQVILLCPAGEIAAAIVIGGVASDAHPAPGNSPRELLVYPDGAEISYDPEAHELHAVLPGGGTVMLVADGGITITGDVIITGKLTASEDVIGGGKSLKNHKHTGVQAGGAQTGAPA